MSETAIDKEAIKQRYREERDKRLRPDGNNQYIEIKNQFGHYLTDPYTPFVEREPKRDHVTFAFIGGGFAGLVTGARLVEQGITDVRIIEKGGDFAGTWYWNRYPGAMCDTAAMIYMPLLEETGHMPTEKYAHAPEILAHCQNIGRQYNLYDNALFHTEVEDLEWDADNHRWIIRTNRGDEFTAQFLGMGTGPLHVPKLPGLDGIEDFKGHSFHTSRWDYDYTGGDDKGALMDKLADKRVGIIGTGATAVQCVPHLSEACGELFVFQRTPSSVDERNNHEIDPEWFKEIATPGWQKRWLENFTQNQAGGGADEDLVQDGWTDLSRMYRDKMRDLFAAGDMNPKKMMEAMEDVDFEKMEAIRVRCNTIVEDQDTAENLKAWYRQLCKRPTFHDEFLQSFNNPNTTLIHTEGKGVERITENGVVVDGTEYELDCIVYASGFEVGTDFARRCGFDPKGRDGKTLSEHWGPGMRTMHGTHVHGFPNMFIVQPTQGAALISNVPHNLTESGQTIAMIVRHAIDNRKQVMEVTLEAEDKWIELLLSGPGRQGGVIGSPDCTPGYYNNEGQARGPGAELFVGYPQGPMAYFKYLEEWRSSGDFEGIEFR